MNSCHMVGAQEAVSQSLLGLVVTSGISIITIGIIESI